MIAKKHRIDAKSIPYILKNGYLFISKLFIVKYKKNDKKINRFTTIISKKISNKANIRNKLKRQIHETIRKNIKESKNKQIDIILIPKKNILRKTFKKIEEDIKNLILNKELKVKK